MFITKDKDYTGCDPDIAAALRQGKTIKCKCWSLNSEDKSEDVIIDYFDSSSLDEFKYRGEGKNDYWFKNATPIRRKKVLKDAVSIMKILVEEGWKYDEEYRKWWHSNGKDNFSSWHLCGTDRWDRYPDNFYTYQEE